MSASKNIVVNTGVSRYNIYGKFQKRTDILPAAGKERFIDMYDVSYIAKWFLNRDRVTGMISESDGISNMKLQKLLYYAQGTFLAVKGEKLFADDLLAWPQGPVIESIDREYKQNNSNPIPFDEDFDDSCISDEDKEWLEGTYNTFSRFSAWKLSEMTHMEEPWKNTKIGDIIDCNSIKDYFAKEWIDWEAS
jgi:uncharacterized phage-associated protein